MVTRLSPGDRLAPAPAIPPEETPISDRFNFIVVRSLSVDTGTRVTRATASQGRPRHAIVSRLEETPPIAGARRPARARSRSRSSASPRARFCLTETPRSAASSSVSCTSSTRRGHDLTHQRVRPPPCGGICMVPSATAKGPHTIWGRTIHPRRLEDRDSPEHPRPLPNIDGAPRDLRGRWLARLLRLEEWLTWAGATTVQEHVAVTPRRIGRRLLLLDRLGSARNLLADAVWPPSEFVRWRWPEARSLGQARAKHLRSAVRKIARF